MCDRGGGRGRELKLFVMLVQKHNLHMSSNSSIQTLISFIQAPTISGGGGGGKGEGREGGRGGKGGGGGKGEGGGKGGGRGGGGLELTYITCWCTRVLHSVHVADKFVFHPLLFCLLPLL